MKDIILLAMSTLPRELQSDDFIASEITGSYEVADCRSQLESTVRYYLHLSSAEEIRIVGLCTDPTINQVITYQDEGPNYRCCTHDKKELGKPLKAWDYFKERVLSSTEASGKKIFFEIVPTDEQQPAPAIKDAVCRIRKIPEKGRLFIVNNGGLRNLYLFLSAILSLLDHEGIKPARIMGTKYNPQKLIVDQAESFDIFSFVTGMNDLLETGDADVLERFFGGDDQPDPVKQVVAAMKNVAYGTQFCDPVLYEKGLDALEPAIDALESGSQIDSLLGIFIDQIRNDYGVLLKKDERTPMDIIAWCVRKKLYQQALTFLESRMPAYFYKTRFYYYDPAFNTDIGRRKARFEEPESYVFNKLLERLSYGGDVRPEDGRAEFLAVRHYAGKTVILKSGKTFVPPADFRQEEYLSSVYNDSARKDKEAGYRLIPKEGLFWSTALPEAYWPHAGRLMRMHRALKVCRNLFNHGLSEERPDLDNIKTVIELYLEAVKALTALCTAELRLKAEQETGRSAEAAACREKTDADKRFVNFSNNPSDTWDQTQRAEAEKKGPIVDIAFPVVPGNANERTIKNMAKDCVAEILAQNPAAVMCQGEFTLSFAVIELLRKEGIPVLAACSERNAIMQDGKRITQFEFKRFRKYE